MPKKKKARKNAKNNSSFSERRKLIEADMEGQTYGILLKALGSRFFDVKCVDGDKRRCKVRSKRMRVAMGDWCIISIRNFDNKNADIIYKYDDEEVRQLKKMGVLPSHFDDDRLKLTEDNDMIPFDFEDI